MATSVSLNSTTYSIPSTGDSGWGDDLSAYLIALSTGVLTKAGGSFTLTAAADFGANYGLKAVSYSSRGTVAGTGVMRLANAESVAWRNAGNSANLELKVNASNVLEFNGNPLLTLALGSGDTALRMNAAGTAYEWAKLTNDNIDAAAAIALSKLATLTASRALVSDGSGLISASSVTSTELGYVSGVTSALQTQLDAKQPLDSDLTAVAGLSSTGLIARTGSGTAAARTITAGSSKLTVTNGDGVSGNPTIDVSESDLNLENMSGQAALDTQTSGTLQIDRGGTGATTQTGGFDNLAPTTAKGDLVVFDGTNNIRLAVGSDGQVLTADSGETSGLAWSSPLTNPMDSAGDLIVGGASGAATKLDSGTSGYLLMAKGAASPEWTNDVTTFIKFRGTAGQVATVDATNADVAIDSVSARHLVFTGFSTSRTVTLPTSGILAGEVFILENTTAQDMVVNASGGSALTTANGCNQDATVRSGYVVLRSTQATPTTPAHWRVIDVYEEYELTTGWQGSSGGSVSSSTSVYIRRSGRTATLYAGSFSSVATSSSSQGIINNTDLPTRFRPIGAHSVPLAGIVVSGTNTAGGQMQLNAQTITFYRDIAGTAWPNTGTHGWLQAVITYLV